MNSTKTSPSLRPLASPPIHKIEVEFADPALKLEAISELFDHCMTPIAATVQHTQNKWQSRARPLSAAPQLQLDLNHLAMYEQPSSALMSPMTPDEYLEEEPIMGTFSDLRRKLYGTQNRESSALGIEFN
ncbi:hypothetical protein EC988_007227 [Linderina pennispora]|nr:hypothetical protein EC988_007227 [Linderina pennispora]